MNRENDWKPDGEIKNPLQDLERLTVVEMAVGMADQVAKCQGAGKYFKHLKKLEFPVLVFELAQHIKTAIKNGAPVNDDGTINLFKFIAWTEMVAPRQGKK